MHRNFLGSLNLRVATSQDADDDAKALKKALAQLKRKRPTGPPSKPKKKTKDGKGPRRKIEYEFERESHREGMRV